MGAHRGVELVPAGLPDLAPQTCGVDETPNLAAHLDQRVHRVHGGARHIVHHRPLVTGTAGSAANSCPRSACRPARRVAARRAPAAISTPRATPRSRLSSRSATPRPCMALTGCGCPSPSDHSCGRVGLAALVVNLVGRQEDRLTGPLQAAWRAASSADVAPTDRIDHQDDRVGGPHGHRTPARPPAAARPLASGSQPPVSCTTNRRPDHSSRRRTPGRGSRRGRPAPPPRGGPGSG